MNTSKKNAKDLLFNEQLLVYYYLFLKADVQ